MEIPPSIRMIGREAFADTGLEKLIIPQTVRTICDRAFASCDELRKADLPSGLEAGRDNPFEGCIRLAEVTEDGKTGVYSLSPWGKL